MVRLKQNKYGAKKVQLDGYTFDSKAEAKRYQELQMLLVQHKIFHLKVHPAFPIEIDGTTICKVILDFKYLDWLADDKPLIYEDVKGRDNALSRLKRKLVEAQYGIKVTIIRA